MRQFDDVSSQRGAPMGRPSFGTPFGKTVSLFRVKLIDGDYDDGGAYWGGFPSEPLYCARGDDYQDFVRAKTRKEAARKLGLGNDLLLRGE
jgi:hypothetical protein